MKNTFFPLFIILLLVIAACKKDESNATGKTIIGKWKQIVAMQKTSTGWQIAAYDHSGRYAQFDKNGTISGTSFPDFRYYNAKNNDTLDLANTDNTKHVRYGYIVTTNDTVKNGYTIKGQDSLLISVADPNCKGICGIRFVRVIE